LAFGPIHPLNLFVHMLQLQQQQGPETVMRKVVLSLPNTRPINRFKRNANSSETEKLDVSRSIEGRFSIGFLRFNVIFIFCKRFELINITCIFFISLYL